MQGLFLTTLRITGHQPAFDVLSFFKQYCEKFGIGSAEAFCPTSTP